VLLLVVILFPRFNVDSVISDPSGSEAPSILLENRAHRASSRDKNVVMLNGAAHNLAYGEDRVCDLHHTYRRNDRGVTLEESPGQPVAP
jgi:hypothetical protein